MIINTAQYSSKIAFFEEYYRALKSAYSEQNRKKPTKKRPQNTKNAVFNRKFCSSNGYKISSQRVGAGRFSKLDFLRLPWGGAAQNVDGYYRPLPEVKCENRICYRVTRIRGGAQKPAPRRLDAERARKPIQLINITYLSDRRASRPPCRRRLVRSTC